MCFKLMPSMKIITKHHAYSKLYDTFEKNSNKMNKKTGFRTLLCCVVILMVTSCNPVKKQISTIRKIHHIPQQREWLEHSDKPDAIARLWTDLYLEDSTIVFVHQQSEDFYVNGLWGNDYNEVIEMLEAEYFLHKGSTVLKELFEDVDISSYKVRRILLDYSGNQIYSLEFEVSDLKYGEKHLISFSRLERLMKLTECLYPISPLEGVSIEKATWNEETGGIDFAVKANHNYDEAAFRNYVEGNWFDIVYVLSYIISYNGIPVTFNIDNNGIHSSISYDYFDYMNFAQAIREETL